jgi:hypothetical protein
MSWRTLPETKASSWTILIRLQVGLTVFFLKGIQKLVFPDILDGGVANVYWRSRRCDEVIRSGGEINKLSGRF